MKTKKYLLKTIALLSFAMLYAGAVSSVRAQVSVISDVSSCTSLPAEGVSMRRVTYYENLNPSSTDLRAGVVNDQFIIRMQGWLYFEEGKKQKNEKVIIYNHGHNDERSEPCALVKYFVGKGFVVFAPLRRGHSARTPGTIPLGWQKISSTGVHTDEYASNCLSSGNCNCNFCGTSFPTNICTYNRYEVDYIRTQVWEVSQQINYIKNRASFNADGTSGSGKLADPTQIAVMGHSYGGSLAVFANAELDSQNVAIVVSGAELSWSDDEPAWETELSCAMQDQKRPIYFLQPKNGRSLAPMKTLFGIAINRAYRSQAAIFPPTYWDPICSDHDSSCWDDETDDVKLEWEQAHDNFISDTAEITRWGKSVKEFIERYPK
jgi:hypothetical protein